MARSTSSPVTVPGTAVNAVPGRSLARHLLISLRPGQWSKNLVLFAALIFAKHLFNPTEVIVVTLAFVMFCLVASGAYVMNDLRFDMKEGDPRSSELVKATYACLAR